MKTRLSGRSLAVDASRADMLTSYEEVVQFLLKTYATEDTMAEAITDVENFKQSSSMDVRAYSDELWTGALRCGSVISSTRLKGYFIQDVCMYGSKGCRICLSLDHTVCPLISDPAARERLMKIREANFRLRRGRRRANLRKNRTDKDVKQAVVL